MIKQTIFFLVILSLTIACDDFVIKPSFKTEEAGINYRKAQEYEMNGQLDSALYYYTQADELSPNTPIILHARGLLKSSMKDYEAALLDLNKSVELSEDQEWKEMRMSNLGLTYMQMGNLKKACEVWHNSGDEGLIYIESYCYE